MPAKWIGVHIPTGKGLPSALHAARTMGCTAAQVFTSSPRLWKSKPISDEMASAFKAAWQETGLGPVISHDTYLVNLCAPSDEIRAKSIVALGEELERCAAYGIDRAVSHIGAHMGAGEEEGQCIAAESLREVLARSPESVTVLAETTAGQGSCLHHRLDSLARFLDRFPSRVHACLDTCHLFAAGYDLRTEEAFTATMDEIGRTLTWERVGAIHVNDSKKPLGSRVDRHDHLGQGEIGELGFRLLVNDPRVENIPLLLETPEAETQHEVNLRRLLDWREKLQ